MRLQDRSAIVTGAASGFGLGIAQRFAAEGARVVLCDINAEAGEQAAAEITASGGAANEGVGNGGTAIFVEADISQAADVKALVAAALAAHGRIDILVNNAGVAQRNGPSLEVDEATFEHIFAVNVRGIYLTSIHAVPAMIGQGGGVVLNISSTAALRPRPGLAWYNASKGAVNTLTKSLAVELAPKKIRVNALCPVAGDTGLLAEFMGGVDTPEMRRKFIDTIPLGRLSTPADLAAAAVYLCSDEADLVTGVCLEIDGGRCV